MRYLWFLPLILLLTACPAGQVQPPRLPPTTLVTLEGFPAVKLSDGRVMGLESSGLIEEYLKRFPNPLTSDSFPQGLRAQALPASVDLRGFQTPIKNQGPRGTCVSFALAAAIEARYNHQFGLSLDLSEEFIHHIQKMNYLNGSPLPAGNAENKPLTEDGSFIDYAMSLFNTAKFAIPTEDKLPYIAPGSYPEYVKTNDAGDNPTFSIDQNLRATTDNSQRTVDDFNLSQTSMSYTYRQPAMFSATMLPQAAQEEAKYSMAGGLSYNGAFSIQQFGLDFIRGALAAGYEVILGFSMTKDDPQKNDGIWHPGSKDSGGHAVLVVGYNDAEQAFLVKNSWGYGSTKDDPKTKAWPREYDTDGDGFIKMSYDWVKEGLVHSLGVVLGAKPPSSPTPRETLWLGRWKMDLDGQKGGLLDIYHLPQTIKDSAISGSDQRIGTYFDTSGKAYRVNGSLNGARLQAWIDFGNSGKRDYDDLSGDRFEAILFDQDTLLQNHLWMAGTQTINQSNKTVGFYATKADYLQPTPILNGPGTQAFVGHWRISLGGRMGTLTVKSVSGQTASGDYSDPSGSYPFTGSIDASGHRLGVVFALGSKTVNASLYMAEAEKGVLAGLTYGNDTAPEWGVVAYHFNTPPSLQIPKPVGNSFDIYFTQVNGIEAEAAPSDSEDGADCCKMSWSLGRSGDNTQTLNGSNKSITLNLSQLGDYALYGLAKDLDGALSPTLSKSFSVTAGTPGVSIFSPGPADPIYDAKAINIEGRAFQNLVDICAESGATIAWSSTIGADTFGPGCKTTATLSGAGPHTLSLKVTNKYGGQGQASVTVTVQPASPISLNILSPSQGASANYDAFYELSANVSNGATPYTHRWVFKTGFPSCPDYVVPTSPPTVIPPGPKPTIYEFWDLSKNRPPASCLGTGKLYLEVSDSSNVSASDFRTFTINPPPPN